MVRLGAPKTLHSLVVSSSGASYDSNRVRFVNDALDQAQSWWIRVTGKGFSIGPMWSGSTWRISADDQTGQISFALGVLDDLAWPRGRERAYVMVVRGSGGLAGQVPLDIRGDSPLILLGDAFVEALLGHQVESNRLQGLPPGHVRGTENAQIGTLCHELGHLVLGSNHDATDIASVMGSEFDQWPRVGLTGEELIAAQRSGWLI